MSVSTARVWNDHTEEHVEEFRGEMIRIPPQSFIEMPWTSAVQFRGQYTPILRDGLGRDLKPKKIRLERVDSAAPRFPAVSKFVCQACSKDCKTQKSLDAHIAEEHVDQMVDEDAKEQMQERKKGGKQ